MANKDIKMYCDHHNSKDVPTITASRFGLKGGLPGVHFKCGSYPERPYTPGGRRQSWMDLYVFGDIVKWMQNGNQGRKMPIRRTLHDAADDLIDWDLQNKVNEDACSLRIVNNTYEGVKGRYDDVKQEYSEGLKSRSDDAKQAYNQNRGRSDRLEEMRTRVDFYKDLYKEKGAKVIEHAEALRNTEAAIAGMCPTHLRRSMSNEKWE